MTYLDEYLNYLKYELCLEEKSVSSYESNLKKYFDYLEDNCIPFNSVREEDILDFLNFNDDKSNNTKSHYITVLKSYYQYLYVSNHIDHNIASFLTTPKKEERMVNFLTIEEVYKLVL